MELGKSKKQQLADQWAPLRWSRYVELPFRKLVWLLVLNISEEVVVFLYQLMTRPAFVVSVLASILFAWLGATKLDYVKVGEVGAVLLIALLTLGVTAVIFIATLMNDRAQESQRKIDEIKKVLKKYSAPILRGISQAITHGATHDAYSSRQLINLYILMKVGDQQDVPYLLELVNKDRARFPSVYQNFDLQNRVKEAYESCGQVRNMVSLLITLPIEVIGQTEHNEAGTLYEELTGGFNVVDSYELTELTGRRVSRVLVYSLLAILFSLVLQSGITSWSWNVLPGVDLHSKGALIGFMIAVIMGAVLLTVRYLFLLIGFIQHSLSQNQVSYPRVYDPTNNRG